MEFQGGAMLDLLGELSSHPTTARIVLRLFMHPPDLFMCSPNEKEVGLGKCLNIWVNLLTICDFFSNEHISVFVCINCHLLPLALINCHSLSDIVIHVHS